MLVVELFLEKPQFRHWDWHSWGLVGLALRIL